MCLEFTVRANKGLTRKEDNDCGDKELATYNKELGAYMRVQSVICRLCMSIGSQETKGNKE